MLLRKNIDIVLGLMAWAVSTTSYLSLEAIGEEPSLWRFIAFFFIPILWIVLVLTAFSFRTRPRLKLWWIWISAPLAFYGWGFAYFVLLSIARTK
jgi:hypothetical protein